MLHRLHLDRQSGFTGCFVIEEDFEYLCMCTHRGKRENPDPEFQLDLNH